MNPVDSSNVPTQESKNIDEPEEQLEEELQLCNQPKLIIVDPMSARATPLSTGLLPQEAPPA